MPTMITPNELLNFDLKNLLVKELHMRKSHAHAFCKLYFATIGKNHTDCKKDFYAIGVFLRMVRAYHWIFNEKNQIVYLERETNRIEPVTVEIAKYEVYGCSQPELPF